MNDLVASLGINSLSKSQVSDMAKDLDVMVEDFRTRPLDTGPYLYVSCDALTMKVREGGRVVKTSVLLATGVNSEGYRELLGMQVATAESVASWTGFFRDLKARGLNEVYLVTSDAHLGIQHAIGDVLPNASWQRCRTHFPRTCPGWCRRRSGRLCLPCSTLFSNSQMRSRCGLRPGMWWSSVSRSSRMWLIT